MDTSRTLRCGVHESGSIQYMDVSGSIKRKDLLLDVKCMIIHAPVSGFVRSKKWVEGTGFNK